MGASMKGADAQKLMSAASGVSVIPIGFFIFFAVSSGEIGAQLALRILPIAALVALGWSRPQVAGWALIVLGIIFGGLYGSTVQDLQIIPTVIVAILFCIPLIASGVFFLRAHQNVRAKL
ncbi:MAG TPA: hypothetical protein VJK53_05750 [Candidatus Paceibacterota bacterium]